jgi:hypothetical protein
LAALADGHVRPLVDRLEEGKMTDDAHWIAHGIALLIIIGLAVWGSLGWASRADWKDRALRHIFHPLTAEGQTMDFQDASPLGTLPIDQPFEAPLPETLPDVPAEEPIIDEVVCIYPDEKPHK